MFDVLFSKRLRGVLNFSCVSLGANLEMHHELLPQAALKYTGESVLKSLPQRPLS